MIWPSFPAGDTSQDSRSGHTNLVIAYSWDIVLLNCFLSERRCGLSQFCRNSPTVLFWAAYTSQCASPPWNWQVTAASLRYQGGAEDGVKTNLAAGMGWYERLWGIWNDSELQSCLGKRPESRLCSRGSVRVWILASVPQRVVCNCSRPHCSIYLIHSKIVMTSWILMTIIFFTRLALFISVNRGCADISEKFTQINLKIRVHRKESHSRF